MPSVISPTTATSKSYAPLADEVNPPFGNVAPAPVVTSNGSIVFSKRLASLDLNSPPAEEGSDASGSRVLRSGSGDYSPVGDKGKSRHYPMPIYEGEEMDIGSQNLAIRASKGKEREWDDDGYTKAGEQSQGSYPPLNDVEEEEKRVQANLAKFTARETARRKAARQSRVSHSPSGSQSTSTNSSTTSLARGAPRPLSVLTEGLSGRKGSVKGYMGSLLGKDKNRAQDVELDSPVSARTTNPYDPQPATATSPTMQPSSPFADPPSASLATVGAASSPAHSPSEEGFGYVGAGWRGGEALATSEGGVAPPKERWWHSLCAWGSDLDGGHTKASKQAGRTNPFE